MGGITVIPSIVIGVGLLILLSVWFDWYTSRQTDREIQKFFDDHDQA